MPMETLKSLDIFLKISKSIHMYRAVCMLRTVYMLKEVLRRPTHEALCKKEVMAKQSYQMSGWLLKECTNTHKEPLSKNWENDGSQEFKEICTITSWPQSHLNRLLWPCTENTNFTELLQKSHLTNKKQKTATIRILGPNMIFKVATPLYYIKCPVFNNNKITRHAKK